MVIPIDVLNTFMVKLPNVQVYIYIYKYNIYLVFNNFRYCDALHFFSL